MLDLEKTVPIPSEMIEPMAALVMARLWQRCEVAREAGDVQFEDAARRLWSFMRALLSIGAIVGSATHFSISVGNHMRQIAGYIEQHFGFNPIFDKRWND